MSRTSMGADYATMAITCVNGYDRLSSSSVDLGVVAETLLTK